MVASMSHLRHGCGVCSILPYRGYILPKGPYLPCVSMAGRVLLAGYNRYRVLAVLGSMQWRHMSVMASQIIRLTTKKISKHNTQFVWFPSQMASNVESVSMSWCHHVYHHYGKTAHHWYGMIANHQNNRTIIQEKLTPNALALVSGMRGSHWPQL